MSYSKCWHAFASFLACAATLAILGAAGSDAISGDEPASPTEIKKEERGSGRENSGSDRDGWPGQLPVDGAWVRYNFKFAFTDGADSKLGTVTLTILGSTIEDGKACRWIEVKRELVDEAKQSKPVTIDKILILEAALLEVENDETKSLKDAVIRTWRRQPDGSVKKVDRPYSIAGLLKSAPGPCKSLTRTNKRKDINYQRGRLDAACCWTGGNRKAISVMEGIPVEADAKWEVWSHSDLPCGFAEAHFYGSLSVLGTKTESRNDYYLQDAGVGAQSELSDWK